MMLYGFVLTIHILVALFLIVVILLQGGRGGMGEALGGAAVQSLFGGGANTVMTKLTAVVAGLFVVTCLSLAALSTARGRSVIDQIPSIPSGQLPFTPDQLPFAPPKAQDKPARPASTPATVTPNQPPAPSANAPTSVQPSTTAPAPANSNTPTDQEGASGTR